MIDYSCKVPYLGRHLYIGKHNELSRRTLYRRTDIFISLYISTCTYSKYLVPTEVGGYKRPLWHRQDSAETCVMVTYIYKYLPSFPQMITSRKRPRKDSSKLRYVPSSHLVPSSHPLTSTQQQQHQPQPLVEQIHRLSAWQSRI